MSETDTRNAVAVVGMACRLPGADNPERFWQNLRAGVESLTVFSREELLAAGVDPARLDEPGFVAAKGVLRDADAFDAGLFGWSAREADLTDPQQRVMLECAWAALEDAGYLSDAPGNVGVFVGGILSMYLLENLWSRPELMESVGTFRVGVGNDPTFLATSLAYQLGLQGPAVSVGTACSTGLVAVHIACQSLLSYECDLALAGGVSIHLPLVSGYRYSEGSILSPDGHCRPFDADARGTVSSDGAGLVVLKRLEDALQAGDFIHAVVLGSAINNDGRDKVGYTAPSVNGQARVIAEAMAVAGVEPETVSMIEGHGAGTPLGDPVEVAALREAFGDCARSGFCTLGSVKSNIGHVDAAAGIAGFLKAALSVRHRLIPPTVHYRRDNPRSPLAGTPFRVSGEATEPPPGPMRAGVSSFGIGGTNVHVVLEEPPARPPPRSRRPGELLLLSARTDAALDRLSDALGDHLGRSDAPPLADVAFTLRVGRRAGARRRAVYVRDAADAVGALRDARRMVSGSAAAVRPSVAFMFPGLGDHYEGMGWEIYCAEPAFRSAVDEVVGLLRPHLGVDLRDRLYPGRDWRRPVLDAPAAGGGGLDLRAIMARARGTAAVASEDDRPELAQPALFVTEYALATLLRSWGIEPDVMVGYSIGELVAAALAGVLSLPDAAALVAVRARLIQAHVGRGAMLAVPLSEADLVPMLPVGVSLAAVNGDALCVAAGESAPVAALEALLAERGVSTQVLRSTHAYHSWMMEAILPALREHLRHVRLHPPKIPYVSCLTGALVSEAEATDPGYWARHLCRTVRFRDALRTLLAEPDRVLVEVGPGQTLSAHALRERPQETPVIPCMRRAWARSPELDELFRGVGALWVAGAPLDPRRLHADGRRVPLPTYPFERRRHWIEPGRALSQASAATGLADWFYVPTWRPSAQPRRRPAAPETWLALVDGPVGDALVTGLLAAGERVVSLPFAARAEVAGTLEALRAADTPVSRVLYGWDLGAPAREPTASAFEEARARGYDGLLQVVRAIGGHASTEGPVEVCVVSDRLFEVDGRLAAPEKVALRAPALVAPQEHPGLRCRVIDVEADPAQADAVVRELLGDGREPAVALRFRRRLVLAYERLRLGEGSPYRARGVYLITGGLGGVGLCVARALAGGYQARLALLSRRPLSEDADDSRAAAVRELEALGGEVLVLGADAADASAMRAALDAVDARFGALHGVFHCAGAVGAETFQELDRLAEPGASDGQFRAKVHGTLVLADLLAGRRLDFCLLMSSLSAVLGGLGFGAYAAANLFLDAFAPWATQHQETPWISLDSDTWRLGPTRARIAGLGGTVSDFGMDPDEAPEVCARVIAAGLAQVVVSTGDLYGRLAQWIEGRGAREDTTLQLGERPELETPFVPPRSELEESVAAIWRELFGVERIGVDDNFFALGGHSLLATQLNARLFATLRVELSLAAVLQAPTVAEIALLIQHQRIDAASDEELERLLAEVEGLA